MTYNPPNTTNHDDLEHQAQAILRQIERANALENPLPETLSNIRALVGELRTALDYNPDDDQTTLLRHQARALDSAFRRLLADGDRLYEGSEKCEFEPMKYAAAFKAQEQFCRTVKALNALKPKKKRRNKKFQTRQTK